MYEIWLVLNTFWEIALGFMPLLVVGLVAWLILFIMALRREHASWGAAATMAVFTGIAIAVIAFFSVPALTQSSLSAMAYWVDWAVLGSIALGIGGAGFLISLPAFALLKGNAARVESDKFPIKFSSRQSTQ